MTIFEQSFCQLDGISPNTEIQLRDKGILSIRQLFQEAESLFSINHACRVRKSIQRLDLAYSLGLLDVVVNAFPCGHRIRLIDDCFSHALFLDVETNGTGPHSKITCISTQCNGIMSSFIDGYNLNDFLKEWASAKLLVTFNGKRFDIPILAHNFGFSTIPAQIDLMDEARHFGYRGGLKAIESQIGFIRNHRGCKDGIMAISLWEQYINTGNQSSLDELVRYNQEDVRSLAFLWRKLLALSLNNTSIMPLSH